MTEQAATLRREYEIRFAGSERYRDAVWRVLCRHFFDAIVPPDGAVLDLGAGWGEFIRNVRASEKIAMDLNPDTGKHVGDEVDFLQHDCTMRWPLEDASLGTVFTSNLLEHLPDKVAIDRTLNEAFRCLRPAGRLICMGPNVRYLPGSYWDFWDHFVPITERSLAEAMQLAGFSIEQCIPRFLPYSMSQGRQPALVFVRAYLRLPLIWPIFGKQFLVVGHR